MLNKAIIDLAILKANALEIKSKLKKGVKFCAVVKADAYGHGAPIIASTLYPIVDYFAVALLEEGIKLRLSGIDKDILLLNPIVKEEAELAVRYDLTVTITDKKQIAFLDREAKIQNKKVKIHLKYNTDMNRQGVDELSDLQDLITFAIKKENITLDGMYSHLAFPQNKKALNCAVNKFLLANNLVKGYNNRAICHISASGGFLRGIQADMVRIGILLYGYKPFKCDYLSVNPIMKIFAPILTTRNLKKGDCALYGSKKAEKDCKITLIRYGYADGLNREEIFGQYNNRCMDHTAIIKKTTKNDWVCVMDNADILAKEYRTISYEILTKAAIRAEKIYIR